MNAIIQSLNSVAGLLSILIVFIVAIISGKTMSKSKISEEASNAQQRAITAMQAEMLVLRGKLEDLKKNNAQLNRTIEIVRKAFERRGIMITISENSIDIEDSKKSTTISLSGEDVA
jgi:hypothetical protein